MIKQVVTAFLALVSSVVLTAEPVSPSVSLAVVPSASPSVASSASLAVGFAATVSQPTTDPVIMTVAGTPVLRSEFEYSYNKNNTDGVIDKKTVEEYVDLFINYKLKVQAALDARLDTTTAFRQEFAMYRDQQVVPTYVTDADMLAEAHRVYDETKADIGPDGLIRTAHILIRLPQKATAAQQQDARRRIDSIYTALQGGADFATLARQLSQDPGSAARGGLLGWAQRNRFVKEFEDAAFPLQPGQMSAPVLSPFGWHIILMKERKQLEPFEYHRENILRYLDQRDTRTRLATTRIEAAAKSAGITRQQVLRQRTDSLSAADPALRYLIQEYHDGLLLYEISNRTIWEPAANDDKALSVCFKKNRKKYQWDQPRFKGMVYHVKDPADVKAVVACVKKLKFSEWNEALRRTFNPDSIIRIRVEKGLFKQGDNALVDSLVFKVSPAAAAASADAQKPAAKYVPLKDYPIDRTYGKLLKRPEDYTDVRGLVTADLQDELERLWVADLRKRYDVTINDDILKTVNHHE